MVNIANAQLEASNCEINLKNRLRHDNLQEKNMGNVETAHAAQQAHTDNFCAGDMTGDNGKFGAIGQQMTMEPKKSIITYEKEEILLLKDSPATKIKPASADDKSCWIDGKPFVFNKNARRSAPGSGRFQFEGFARPSFREKTGREFCEDMLNRQNQNFARPIRTKGSVNFYNPVNKDHRRLMEENPHEEPEWMYSGPTSRYDTIELGGFEEFQENGAPIHSSPASVRKIFQHQQNRQKQQSLPFQFDDFLGGHHQQGSRFKQYFRNENQSHAGQFSSGEHQTHHNHHHHRNPLLNILHGNNNNNNQNRGAEQQQNSGHASFNNLNRMTSMEELENNMATANLMSHFSQNRQYLAGKAMLEVLNVFQQQQQQRNQMLQQQRSNSPPNEQLTKMFDLHRQIQAANPQLAYQANNPAFWEDIHQRQQAYYQHYQQTHPQQHNNNMAAATTPPHRSKPPHLQKKHQRHVHFSPKSQTERIAQFFAPEVVAQASTVKMPDIDAEKAMKVEEFERKIKAVAATCVMKNAGEKQ